MPHRLRTTLLAATATVALTAAGTPTIAAASHTAPGTSRVIAIRSAAHPGFDRLVFEFSGKLPSGTFVAWAPEISYDGSGERVRAAGNAFLQIGLNGVSGYDSADKPTFGPLRRSVALPNLNQVVHAGEFEGMVSFGASLLSRTSFTTSMRTNPSRVVIDIRNDYARTRMPVYFVDTSTLEARSVSRWVPKSAPATGALHRMFAGPTAAEAANGVGNVRSGAKGFTALSIRDGLARVRLVGRCSSHGSTFTIANQIEPTLKSLPGVRWVKIYAPNGETGSPTGHTDSIPGCLEP